MTDGKTHLAIHKSTWEQGVLSGHFATAWVGLDMKEIPNPTWSDFEERVKKIETGVQWHTLDGHQEDQIYPLLKKPETRLLQLIKGSTEIGYSLITAIEPELKNRFWSAANDPKVIEIRNLALFDGHRGGGLGKSFFEMAYKDLFKEQNYNHIYWGCSDFNADTLVPFYTDRMRMKILGYDAPKSEQPKAQVA